MKKALSVLLSILMILTGCSTQAPSSDLLNIAVTIQPEIGMVKAVIGEHKANIIATIPPGNSPANYQPAPKELSRISDADVYFSIGVPAEHNILPKVVNPNTKVVSLLDAVKEKHSLRHMEEHDHEEAEENSKVDEEGIDPHIWMSPKRVITMINTIVSTLSTIDPDHKDDYVKNGNAYITQLEELDREIRQTLSTSNLKGFIIYHPSMGYFADDYGLDMHVIEEGGKEATISSITKIVDLAKSQQIKVIFYQEEFDSKQAKLIAGEVGGQAIALDILSEDYLANMKKIIKLLVSQ